MCVEHCKGYINTVKISNIESEHSNSCRVIVCHCLSAMNAVSLFTQRAGGTWLWEFDWLTVPAECTAVQCSVYTLYSAAPPHCTEPALFTGTHLVLPHRASWYLKVLPGEFNFWVKSQPDQNKNTFFVILLFGTSMCNTDNDKTNQVKDRRRQVLIWCLELNENISSILDWSYYYKKLLSVIWI